MPMNSIRKEKLVALGVGGRPKAINTEFDISANWTYWHILSLLVNQAIRELDQEDVEKVWLLYHNPDCTVRGPNDFFGKNRG